MDLLGHGSFLAMGGKKEKKDDPLELWFQTLLILNNNKKLYSQLSFLL